jgi:hypothetical protein
MTFMRMPSTATGAAVPAGARAASQGWGARLWAATRQLPRLARQHWLLSVLLAAGLALRVLSQVAYRPALLYIDSIKYLFGAYPGDDPPGYEAVIKPVTWIGNVDLVVAIQHLLGLAMAVTIYLVLLRRGTPRWLSALAIAPVLLDAYQVQIEQNVMPDVMFEALVVLGVAALLWRRAPMGWFVVTAGLALGASATARQVGEAFIVPALLYVLITVPGWRRRLAQAGLLCVAFLLPILAASFRNYVDPELHSFSLAPYASGTIYGRLAYAADCSTLKLPYYEQELCPDAQQRKLGPDVLDHGAYSPIKGYTAAGLSPFQHQVLTRSIPTFVRLCRSQTPEMCSQVTGAFDHAVIKQQPLRVAASIGRDTLKLFALTRDGNSVDPPLSRWQFQTSYPQFRPYVMITNGSFLFHQYNHYGVEKLIATGQDIGGGPPAVVHPLASFLRAYQLDGGYTPGPLFLFAVLAGLAGSLAALRRRVPPAQRAAALACLLFFVTGVVALLSSDIFEFNWRYQLPALITLLPAAALAITLLLPRTASLATAGGEVIPDPLEPGHGRRDDHTEREQDYDGQPGRSGPHQDARGDRARDDGGEDTQASGQPIRLASGHQPGDETREGAGQVGG